MSHRGRWLSLAVVALIAGGCGIVPAPLPNEVKNFSLGTVTQIQNDNSFTADDRQALVRSYLGLADDDAGNRIATFVIGLTVPQPTGQ